MADVRKETPLEFCTRKVEIVRKMLWKYGELLAPEEENSFNVRFNEVSEKLAYSRFNQEEIVNLYREVSVSITAVRVAQIREKVQEKLQSLTKRFGDEFSKTLAATKAIEWLEGCSGEYKIVIAWINAGNDLLHQELDAPWGRCQCGQRLSPIKVGDRMMVFRKCPTCYHAEDDAKEILREATRGNHHPPVKKPGSASRRKGPKPASMPAAPVLSAEEPKKEKKKGTKK